MEISENVQNVYDVFKDYYGEKRLDIQRYDSSFNFRLSGYLCLSGFDGWYIMIHWPEVEVVNEKDEKVTIWGLYGIVFINGEGRLQDKPVFNRSTYNLEQYSSGYVHSHLHTRRLNDIDQCKEFSIPCLGSGPINSTIHKLEGEYDIDIWRMFCWELDKMVHVESLTGGPYIRMSTINGRLGDNTVGLNQRFARMPSRYIVLMKKLYHLVINNNLLTFSYVNSQYVANVDDVRTILKISDCFINAYNNDESLKKEFPLSYLKNNIIMTAYLYNNKLFTHLGRMSRFDISNKGTTLFKFKGHDVALDIIATGGRCNQVTIITPLIITTLIYNIQKLINIYYGREAAIAEENGEII